MSEHDFETNVQVGDFQIERRLAAGGMGIVYRAHQISENRLVALKVLGSALTRPQNIARFQREAQIASRLDHPAIAKVYYVGQDEHLCYMAMELIDGITLRQMLDAMAATTSPNMELATLLDQPETIDPHAPTMRFDDPTSRVPADELLEPSGAALPTLTEEAATLIATEPYVRRACEIARDAARALDYAHNHRVVHRDIKPTNLMLDRAGEVHVIDFGVARFFEDATMTITGQLLGTPMYMSPEQVVGRIEIDHRTDVYSLGIVLYELLTLRPPVTGPTRDAILRQIATKAMPPLSWCNRGVPKALEDVVHKAIAKDPDERYQTAGQLADDLQRHLDGRAVEAEPFHYRFDEREIAAERPDGVLSAAFVFFFLAVLCVPGVLVVLARGGASAIGSAGVLVAFAVGCCLIGKGLLSGRPWARSLGMVAAALAATTVLAVVGGLILENLIGLGLSRTVGHLAELTSILGFAFVVVFFGGLVSVVLGRHSTADWFRYAKRARREHFQQAVGTRNSGAHATAETITTAPPSPSARSVGKHQEAKPHDDP